MFNFTRIMVGFWESLFARIWFKSVKKNSSLVSSEFMNLLGIFPFFGLKDLWCVVKDSFGQIRKSAGGGEYQELKKKTI